LQEYDGREGGGRLKWLETLLGVGVVMGNVAFECDWENKAMSAE
jgi:hypothetical protein